MWLINKSFSTRYKHINVYIWLFLRFDDMQYYQENLKNINLEQSHTGGLLL